MDSKNFHSGAPCNHAFRDITNTEGRKSCILAEEQAMTGTNGENNRKRKMPFYESPGYHDKVNNDVIHLPKASEACRHTKRKTPSFVNPKLYDSQSSNGNDESQGQWLVDKLSLGGTSSSQLSRSNNEADNSTIGHVLRSNCEVEDILTESDELKKTFGLSFEQVLRDPVHPIKDHNKSAFSDHTSLDWSIQSKRKVAVGEILTHEKSDFLCLCGSYPCSSCTKAAYMWSDLIYQDARGRLSALKSSRRHAKLLEEKILRHENIGETSQFLLMKARTTESDLLQHWTSLLLRTEDTLLCDIMQTQSRLIEIENLKEKLKRDLETINFQPQKESDE